MRGLDRVGILILVDQDEIEPAADIGREVRHLQHPLPPQQQIVVVEHTLALLGLDIGPEQLLQLAGPLRAPGERRRAAPTSSGAWALTA